MSLKYNCTIYDVANEDIFYKQCLAIEKNIPGIQKHKLLEDVDCSKIQEYSYGKNEVKVYNDYYINAVYVESTEDIQKYFTHT